MNNDNKYLKNMEVEIRALVPNFNLLQKNLISKGAKYKEESYLHDIYFCPKDFSNLEEVEMNKVGSYSLRLRKSRNGDNADELRLNTKTITKHGDHNAWEEHEISVDDFKETIDILKVIGFKPFFELEKTRLHYEYLDLGIFLDDIKDFGACLELEKMVYPGQELEAKQEILDFLREIGIDEKQIVPKSVTNIVMKERAFK